MSKRPSIDLLALTSEEAAPLPEAVQRIASTAVKPPSVPSAQPQTVKTENLHGLAFKVPPAFRKRFRQRAADADLKLNELLFEALAAWEEKHGITR
ncbi:MAG: hypothetical protein ACYC3I_19875 [Gemmataceae bacterium]